MFMLALALLAEGTLVANLLARQAGHDFLAAIIQSEIILLTNAERAQNNVLAVKENLLLDQSAQAKAKDMARLSYFAHNGPDGKQPWAWITEAGYDYQYAGENLAVRFVDSKDVLAGWMASPTHRANIIKPVYTETGVGIAQGIYKGEPATFVVQYFGKPAVQVLGVETAAPLSPPPFVDSLARQIGRLFSEPRATANRILGGIALLSTLALAFAFFRHLQIQAHDLLLSGAAVAVIALTLLFINGVALPGVIHDSQAASVGNAILAP